MLGRPRPALLAADPRTPSPRTEVVHMQHAAAQPFLFSSFLLFFGSLLFFGLLFWFTALAARFLNSRIGLMNVRKLTNDYTAKGRKRRALAWPHGAAVGILLPAGMSARAPHFQEFELVLSAERVARAAPRLHSPAHYPGNCSMDCWNSRNCPEVRARDDAPSSPPTGHLPRSGAGVDGSLCIPFVGAETDRQTDRQTGR